ICSISASSVAQQIKTPLMGWASWNNYRVNINENIIKKQADALVASGLSAVGFKYVNIDDGYFNQRYADGTFRLDSIKFPNGMKAVADYIHQKGLRAGFYSEAGANTCGSIWDAQQGGIGGGLYGHDEQDIHLFMKTWGFDYLKVDFCGGLQQKLDERTRYTAVKQAIDRTGRTDINFNVCRWQFPGTWVTKIANSWRISQDITPDWKSIVSIIRKNTFLAAYADQGHYNDMDMLEVGRGLTNEEDKSHFSLWCILSSPLILGNDLTNLSQQTKDILTNTEVIAVNQDTTGLQARLIADNGKGLQIWAKNLNGRISKERAVVLFNAGETTEDMTVSWRMLHLKGNIKVRDLWAHRDLSALSDTAFTAKVPPHGVVMLKVTGAENILQQTFEAEYSYMNNYSLLESTVVKPHQADVARDTSCSGGAKAVSLGNNAGNWIEFRDVFANKSGIYRLTITYLCADDRDIAVQVNGKESLVRKLNAGSLTKAGNRTVAVRLTKGRNTIRLSNAKGWMPDIDKINIDVK
ncbi:alpha-galactosidase, partial [Chitinophaga sp.]|uniref:alpha-galactosidase D n=1 Tax=Chitinophaga sp. TaxID=1869181 RepID=UPI002F928C6B